MKNIVKQSLVLTLLCLVLFAGVYPLLISAIAKLTPGGGDGVTIERDGKVVGYANIGQSFTEDKYFYSRPSAVGYNAAGSAGSNKGPTNPDYLKAVQDRIDTFLAHNPGVDKKDIPADLVTASGSGLDPNISVQGALVQVSRISKIRNIPQDKLKELVNAHTEKPLMGLLGPEKVNVLKLNLALDELR